MSYRAMLRHRCTILSLRIDSSTSSPVSNWYTKAEDVRCFIDLLFIRKGRDPMWTPEAGRVADRTGVLFLLGDAPLKSGDRVIITKGPSGTFSVEGAFDEAWRPSSRHHLEVGVVEVATQLSRGSYNQGY